MARISRVVVKELLGYYNVSWDLRPGVNILSGANGSGKSTLLRAVGEKLLCGSISTSEVNAMAPPVGEVDITIEGGTISADEVIVVNRSLGRSGCSLMEYQGAGSSEISEEHFDLFCDIIDELLESSAKRVDRGCWRSEMGVDDLVLEIYGRADKVLPIRYEWLSAGEQLALSLIFAVAVRGGAKVMLLDEPEVSLSIEWQKTFLENILRLNSALQIIVATHSPALIMRGWVDRVTEIEDIQIV